MQRTFTLAYLAALLLAGVAPAAADTSVAHIHGKVVSIDPKSGTFMIHHDPFKEMPMAMTMPVKPKNRADLARLHVGEIIDVTIDTSIDPWPGTNIHPAQH